MWHEVEAVAPKQPTLTAQIGLWLDSLTWVVMWRGHTVGAGPVGGGAAVWGCVCQQTQCVRALDPVCGGRGTVLLFQD